MAARDQFARAGDVARAARENRYVQLLLEDDDFRDNLRTAAESARGAYGRLSNGKAPTEALMKDKKLQRNLRDAAEALQAAGHQLKEGPKKKKKHRLLKLTAVAVVGTTLALVLSEGLRNKVLDLLFGAEEEFEYTSTTMPPVSPPAPADTTATATPATDGGSGA
jgi:hypothetical protein